jgi:replicative DNA helicase
VPGPSRPAFGDPEAVSPRTNPRGANRGSGGRVDGSARVWGPPVPLDTGAAIEPFPVHALPPWLGAQVDAVAATSATPPDLAGVLGLAVLATVAGGRVEVEPQAGWREGTNLFLAGVMEPGERKSAVFALMMAPLDEHEKLLAEATLEDRMLAAQRFRIAEARRTRAEKAAAGAEDQVAAEEDAVDAARAVAGIAVPPEPRLYTDDVTSEALAGLLAEHGGRMAVLSADPSMFAIAAGRYSNGAANLEVYLKGHANDPLRVDRRGRPSERVDRPALTVGVTVQPAVLREAGRNAQFRGRGLLDRFLYAAPGSMIGYRPIRTPALPADVAGAYRDGVLQRARTLDTWREPPLMLGLDQDAVAVLDEWRERLERRQQRGKDLEGLRGWASKLGGATVRMAGLLHVARNVGERLELPIDAETMRSAVELARYFVPHAQVVFDLMGDDPALDLARRIVTWLELKPRDSFSRRDVLRDVHPRPHAKEAAASLSLLESYGYVAAEDRESGIGRPTVRYAVNPAIVVRSGQ